MTGRRTRRCALLLGTAAVALAGASAAADDKWQPYAEIYGRAGTERAIGGGEVFYPLYQDDESLLFLDLRGRADTDDTAEGNVGLAYRTKIDDSVVLGGYGYVDVKRSELDNTFWNLTVGLEALSRDWDLRVNGYLPLSDAKDVTDGVELVLTDTFIALQSGLETPLHGLDAEIGWRVPLLPADGDQEVRVFAGGYWFDADDVDAIAGPRARLEYRLYDVFGNGSRLTFDTVAQWDEVRGTDVSAGVSLRIPFTFVEARQQAKLTGLDRRMVDKIQRDVDIVTSRGEGILEPVKVENLLTATHQIRFVQTGESIQGAAEEMGDAGIIVAQGDSGPLNGPIHLYPGQALIGGGHTVKLTGAQTGSVVMYTPAGTRPEVFGNGSVAVTLANDNFVGGLDIMGTYGTGIQGEVERTHLRDNYLAPDEGNALDGISLRSLNPHDGLWIVDSNHIVGGFNGDGIGLALDFDQAGVSQTVRVVNNSVGAVSGKGISALATGTGGSATQNLLIEGNWVYETGVGLPGDAGILVHNDIQGPADFSQALAVNWNDLEYFLGSGIVVLSDVYGEDARLEQDLEIAENYVYGFEGSTGDGIAVMTYANGGGYAEQNLLVAFNLVEGVGGAGFLLDDGAFSGGLDQTLEMVGNQVWWTGVGYRFAIDAEFGWIGQDFEIRDNSVAYSGAGFQFEVGFEDIYEGTEPHLIEDTEINQTISLVDNAVYAPTYEGFSFITALGEDTYFSRRVYAAGNEAATGDYAAFLSHLRAVGDTEEDEPDPMFDDAFLLFDNDFSSVSEDAVYLGYKLQFAISNGIDLGFEQNRLQAGGAGIVIENQASDEASSEMEVEIVGNVVQDSGVGFRFENAAEGAAATQDVFIDDNSVLRAFQGLRLNNESNGGYAAQTVNVADSSFTEVTVDGAYAYNQAGEESVAIQTLDFQMGGNTIEADFTGISLNNFEGTQFLYMYGGVDITAGVMEIDTVNAGGGTQSIDP